MEGTDFLTNVAEDAFDRRPVAWARAIAALLANAEDQFKAAAEIRERLRHYTWRNCAQALVEAAGSDKSLVSKQGPGGTILFEEIG